MKFTSASDIQSRISEIIKALRSSHINFDHVREENVVCMRSFGSKARALARIWSLPKIWQKALGTEAHYIIEVLSNKFDNLNKKEQDKVLIHELLHIPKTFSGGLRPHHYFNQRINSAAVEKYYKVFEACRKVE